MQEDIKHRSVTLVINSGQQIGRMLRKAVIKLLAYWKYKRQEHQSVFLTANVFQSP